MVGHFMAVVSFLTLYLTKFFTEVACWFLDAAHFLRQANEFVSPHRQPAPSQGICTATRAYGS